MTTSLRKGDRVQVWSAGTYSWVVGEVTDVVEVPRDNLVVGAVQVSYMRNGQIAAKYIHPSLLSKQVKLIQDVAASPVLSPLAQVAEGLCKYGCGRNVQPGLTRTMKKYDTCCKTCAMTQGRGGHDEGRCGEGRMEAMALKRKVAGRSVREWLEKHLSNASDMDQHVKAMLALHGSAPLDQVSVHELLTARLLAPLGLSKVEASTVPQASLHRVSGNVSEDEFRALSLKQLHACKDAWFPAPLVAKQSTFVRHNRSQLNSTYSIGRKLGEGSFGVTFIAVHRASGQERICKKIHKKNAQMSLEDILGEIQSMASLDHPNIVKMFEYFDEPEYVTQIQEFNRGGELWDRLPGMSPKGKREFTESEIRTIMKQLLKALAFMHDEECELHPCFLHKDLKPQNLMFAEPEGTGSLTIKVIDFGLTEVFKKTPDAADKQECGGSAPWMAPEVVQQHYREKADIWSSGCILYNMIALDHPFPGSDLRQLLLGVLHNPPKPMGTTARNRVGPQCHNLLELMLTKDPNSRPSASECLRHAWFQDATERPPTLSVGVVQALSAFVSCSTVRRALFYLMAYQCSLPANNELRKIYTHFDGKNRGLLDVEDLKHVLLESGLPMLYTERIVSSLDTDGSGSVEWTEFTSGCQCLAMYREKLCIDLVFSFIDTDQDGYITKNDVIAAFLPEGPDLAVWQKNLDAEWGQMAGGHSRCDVEHFAAFMGSEMHIIPTDSLVAR